MSLNITLTTFGAMVVHKGMVSHELDHARFECVVENPEVMFKEKQSF